MGRGGFDFGGGDMGGNPQLIVKMVGWSETAREHLCQVMAWPDHASPDGYRDALEAGEINALGVFSEDEQIGTTFYRFDVGDQGQEMVIMASAGHLPGVDLVGVVLPLMERLALEEGCCSVAFETARRGLVKKTAGLGYNLAHVTLRKSLGSEN